MKRTPIKRRTPLRRSAPGQPARLKPQGRKARRDASPSRTWRGIVQLRNHGLCQSCKEREGTECHHLFPRGSHPELRHDPRNGAHLCAACHLEAHRRVRSFRAAFARDWPYFDAI